MLLPLQTSRTNPALFRCHPRAKADNVRNNWFVTGSTRSLSLSSLSEAKDLERERDGQRRDLLCLCKLCLLFTYRDNGILRRGVPFSVILERSEESRRGHLSLRMTVLICWLCLLFTYRGLGILRLRKGKADDYSLLDWYAQTVLLPRTLSAPFGVILEQSEGSRKGHPAYF